MKALSIKQPWTFCITDLNKSFENRTWAPPAWILGHRIALHASKGDDTADGWQSASWISGRNLRRLSDLMPRGAIVGTAVIAGYCSDTGDFKIANECLPYITYDKLEEMMATDRYFVGPFGWLLLKKTKLERPIPCKGALGLWNVPAEIDKQLWSQLEVA